MMMRIMVKKVISIVLFTELLVLGTYFFSSSAFASTQVAFLSSLLVIIGSSLAYKKMVVSNVESDTFEGKRDLLDDIEDPHELYDDEQINYQPAEELNLKEIVKEEKAKIKTFSFKSIKHGARGSVSLFRILPYIFLILGFIALKNNELLELKFYLPALLLGIVVGSIVSKETID